VGRVAWLVETLRGECWSVRPLFGLIFVPLCRLSNDLLAMHVLRPPLGFNRKS
jgi:hypothetical protein